MKALIQALSLLTLSLLLAEAIPAQPSAPGIPQRQRRRSPIESEIFLGNWWNYYNRGLKEFDQGNLAAAERDFREALKFHPEESARARTYGVRFQEYYPRVELGAVLYESGRFQEAIPVLQESLKSASFEQTKFYLHESRRKVALMSPIDKGPPKIEISEPASELITNQNSIRIRGTAVDDIFIDKIVVGDRALLVERAKGNLQFQTDVAIQSETNEIPVTVYDLLGQQQTQIVRVTTDHQGPALSLRRLEVLAGGKVHLAGTIYDKHLVSHVLIDGIDLPTQGIASQDIDCIVAFPPSQETVKLVMADGFGNETVAPLNPRLKVGMLPSQQSHVRVASARMEPAWIAALSQQGPRIDLLGLQPNQRVFLKEVYVDGRVYDGSGVAEVRFGDRPLDLPPGTDLYFGLMAGPLRQGPNEFPIKARNVNGVETVVNLALDCKPPTELPVEQRLAVTVPDFEIVGPEAADPTVAGLVRNAFVDGLLKRGRFNVVESSRLSSVLMEREITEVSDSRYRVENRSLTAADLVLDGQLIVRSTTLLLSLYTVNVQTAKVEARVQVQCAGKSALAMRDMGANLALKLEQEYPVVEGEIFRVEPRFLATLSKQDRVREGMQLIAFHRGPEIILPNGRSVGFEFFDIGPMRLSGVREKDYSEVIPGESMTQPPQLGDLVRVR
jgi:hypothetical protein